MKPNEILKIMKSDLKSAEQSRKDQDLLIETRKKEYNGEPYGNEGKSTNRSKIVSRDIKKQDEWQHATLKDPFVSSSDIIKCSPVTWEDREVAEQSELILNTQFCRQFNRFSFMTKAIKVLSIEGTCVVQTGWEYEEEEIEVEIPIFYINPITGEQVVTGTRTETQIKVLVNKPTAKVCRNEDVFIDPTCQDDLDNAQFVIYRYETDLSTLRQDGRYKNLDKVANMKEDSKEDATSDWDYDPEDETEFKFTDNPRKKIIVYEYWGYLDRDDDGIAEPVVCAWVGNVIIRLEDNPFPDKKVPFIVIPFSAVPFSVYGESNADLISDNQKINTAMLRGIVNSMASANGGQKGVPKGLLDNLNSKRFFSGENYEYNPGQGQVVESTYTPIPNSAFDTIALMKNDIESMTGVKSFSGGISGNSLGSTATGARGALDATATRRLNIVRNIAENLIKPLMRKWMVYNSEFLEDSQVVRITNDKFVEIRRDDLAGNIDIDIQVSTAEDNSAKAQELSFLLQTLGQDDIEYRKIIQIEIAKLQRMPDLAKKIEEYQPQPDPIAQRKAELEIALLEAQIANEQAKGMENAVDVELKKAKTANELANARLVNEDTDLKALQFLEKSSGAEHLKEIEKQKQKTEGDLMKERAKQINKQVGN
jgi:hypothetical protein